MTKRKKTAVIVLAVITALVTTLLFLLLCSYLVLYFSGLGQMETYEELRDISREQTDAVSDYLKLEKGRITDIEKIILVDHRDGTWIYIFADVDWPGLFTESEHPRQKKGTLVMCSFPGLFRLPASFRYDRAVDKSYETPPLTIYRLGRDDRVVLCTVDEFHSSASARDLMISLGAGEIFVSGGIRQ